MKAEETGRQSADPMESAGSLEPDMTQVQAAAAHFDIKKLTPDSIEKYQEYIAHLAQTYGKK